MAAESPRSAPRRSSAAKNGAGLLSPRFRSAAELAGWDEESILLAALVVEDTPVRESRRKRRPSSAATGSAGSNTRKRRSRRQSPGETPIPPVTLALDDDEKPNDHEVGKKEKEQGEKKEEEEKVSAVEGKDKSKSGPDKEAAATTGDLPCMDRLREELSCAICLDVCYQPSTTPCGHSFCMQCLKHAASKCGKRCPKCRQLISNSRSCTINTVLWNTIQLLFPSEVEARKSSMASGSASKDDVKQSLPRSNNITTQGGMSRNTGSNFTTQDYTRIGNATRSSLAAGTRRSMQVPGSSMNISSGSFDTQDNTRIGNTTRSSLAAGSRRSMQGPGSSMNSSSGSFDTQGRSTRSRDSGSGFVRASQLVATRSSARSGQSDDASLAYRLQQEEFMTAFDNEEGARQPQNAVSSARANLRAMASRAERAVLLRARGWPL